MTDEQHPRRRRRDTVLDPQFIRDLRGLALAELRSRRKLAEEEEAELSYVRRLLQSRLDVIDSELQRRRQSTQGGQIVADVVAVLTAETTDEPRHVAPSLDPSPIAQQRRAVERLLADPALSYVTVLSTDDLAVAREQVNTSEQEVSSQRLAVQAIVDSLTDELMQRYRNRQATIDTLLT